MTCTFDAPIGRLLLEERGGALVRLDFAPDAAPCLPASSLLTEAARQLGAYFAGTLRAFDLPTAPGGTAFQRAVWDALAAIPYGETRTYGRLAAAVGNPRAARAVGGACHCNPLMILIPCHRAVGAAGLTGFACGLTVKKALLRLENGAGV